MKDIKHYIGKPYYIKCNNQEEWNFIITESGHKLKQHDFDDYKYLNMSTMNSRADPNNSSAFNRSFGIIEASEFMNPQFEVGKWYRLPNCSNYLGKYEKKDWVSEYICNEGRYYNSSGSASFKNAIECTKEELMQYLPKDHVDYPKDERWTKNTYVIAEFNGCSRGLMEPYEQGKLYQLAYHEFSDKTIGLKEFNNICDKNNFRLALPHEIPNNNLNNLTTKTNNQNDTSKTESIQIRRTSISISRVCEPKGESIQSKTGKIEIGRYIEPTGIRSIQS